MNPEVCGLGVQNFGRYGFWQRTAQTMAAPDLPPLPRSQDVPGDVFFADSATTIYYPCAVG